MVADVGYALGRASSQIVGTNQFTVRARNELAVLTQLLHNRSMSRADLARATGLSAQAVSVIIRGLESDGLLKSGDRVRGKVGQPSVPMMLNPDGAYGVGLRIGRRSADLSMLDLHGKLRAQLRMTYRYPLPQEVVTFAINGFSTLCARVGGESRARITGLGIGSPFELWNWLDRLGAPRDQMAEWQVRDIAGELSVALDLPVILENDASGACLAENLAGHGRQYRDFAYFYIGSFVGGGVVLNGQLLRGASGNAGAFGSIMLPRDAHDDHTQLLDLASLHLLEERLMEQGHDVDGLWDPDNVWTGYGPCVNDWIGITAHALAQACVSVAAVLDIPNIVVDGALPRNVLSALCEQLRTRMETINTQGIAFPQIHEGNLGHDARAIGAAMLPINARYFTDLTLG